MHSMSVVYNRAIKELFNRLKSITRMIFCLWCIIWLLRSSFTV